MQLKGIVSPPPVFICAVEPETAADEKSLLEALQLLQMEDPSFHLSTDADSGQMLVDFCCSE
jgi:elongation factor G